MPLLWTTITDPSDAATTPGVYQYIAGQEIIYIGKSVNLRARLKSHAQNARHDTHEKRIQEAHTKIRFTLTDSDFLATLLEAKLIREHLPRYNRILRDDKSYLYIVINMSDDYPKPRLIRAHDLPIIHNSKPKIHIFGPFQTRKIAEDILKTIRRLIPFCQQSRVGKRACFYHKLGLCDPCPSKISTKLDKKRYLKQIRQITKILSGNIAPVVKDLEKQLQLASDQQDYEFALTLRNRLTRFQSNLTTHHYTPQLTYSSAEADLQDLHNLLTRSSQLATLNLFRIECYDASTFQLHNSTVSMVVATDGQLDKSQYRRFKIKNPRANSDFTMLHEALSRRLKNQSWPSPDLLVVDGGRPQLRKLQPLLDQLENPPIMIGLAKHPDKIILPVSTKSSLTYQTINLNSDSGTLHLLQRLRDEAHRFANSYRKVLEKKQKQL